MTVFFNKAAAQGDVMFIKVDKLPDSVAPAKSEQGKFVVAHSETGHHHTVLERPDVQVFEDTPLQAFIKVSEEPTEVVHERSWDTHGTIGLNEGIYKVRRQREYTPEGYRRAMD